MNQNKKQGGQGQGTQQDRGRPRGNRGSSGTEGSQGGYPPERGRGSQGEWNPSSSGGGISNRGMDRDEEQEGLPDRGSERGSDDQSER